ncbi:hypothetical protein [Fundidesulfovibrio magnetotacticus]|nr:hypothetical protein [Fundidesulfovibrio magnetotacticus]
MKLPGIGESSEEYFVLEFSGGSPVLSAHQIAIREYARSLAGYDFFVRHIAREMLRTDVNICVSAQKSGSYESHLHAFIDTIGAVSSILGILSFFGVSAKSVREALSRLQAVIVRKYKHYSGDMQQYIAELAEYSILSDGDKDMLLKALENEPFLEALDDFTSPLDSDGYDMIRVVGGGEELFAVSKADRQFFKFVPPAGEKTEDFEDTVELLYISPELIKWKFKGQETFWADVLDVSFLEATGNVRSTELKGVKYDCQGRKVLRRKRGSKKWISTYYIDKIEERQQQMSVF